MPSLDVAVARRLPFGQDRSVIHKSAHQIGHPVRFRGAFLQRAVARCLPYGQDQSVIHQSTPIPIPSDTSSRPHHDYSNKPILAF